MKTRPQGSLRCLFACLFIQSLVKIAIIIMSLPSSMVDFVPCDCLSKRLQKAYCRFRRSLKPMMQNSDGSEHKLFKKARLLETKAVFFPFFFRSVRFI